MSISKFGQNFETTVDSRIGFLSAVGLKRGCERGRHSKASLAMLGALFAAKLVEKCGGVILLSIIRGAAWRQISTLLGVFIFEFHIYTNAVGILLHVETKLGDPGARGPTCWSYVLHVLRGQRQHQLLDE